MPSSKVSSQPRDQTQVSYFSPALAGRFFTTSTSWEASYTCLTSPIISINHQNGVFVLFCFFVFCFLTKDEPTLTHHNHPQSIGYLRVHRWCGAFHGLDKGTMMCIHHYCTMQNSFSALRSSHCIPLPHPWKPLIFSLFPQFYLFHNVIWLESYGVLPFQIGFFYFVINA